MERKVRRLCQVALSALILLCVTQFVRAQAPTQARVVVTNTTASERHAGDNFHSSFAAGEFAFDGRLVVEGAPFSAVAVKETTQTLSDGTQVVRRLTARVYRDSAGRTRTETVRGGPQGPAAGVPMIYDAPMGAVYMLSPSRHTALQLSAGAARQGNVITPQSPPEDIKQVVGDTVESLGTQVLDGVTAEGVRVTSAIQFDGYADKVVYERWYAQELRRNVLIKCSDPRIGTATYRLTEIKRVEPDAVLFVVPADYTIVPFKAGPSVNPVKAHYQN
ncbi:MAG: hypothetical protein ACJ74W_12960 [Pyrinomonadaceae bacterium]